MSFARLLAPGLLLVVGCQFRVAAVDVSTVAPPDLAGSDGAQPPDLAVPEDLAGADLAGEDLAVADDLASADLAGADLARDMAMFVCPGALFCSGATLTHCDGGTVACGQLGCEPTTGGPHCKLFYPSGAVTRGDLTTAGVTQKTISATTTLHTDTGEITGVRAANADPDVEQGVSGIAYRRRSGVGIFTFGGLIVSNNVTLRLVGSAPVALVSTGNMLIAGVLDARGYDAGNLLCNGTVAGPGGGAGAGASAGGGAGLGGNGAGSSAQNSGGGGGAGHGDVGGAGGYEGANSAPSCGTVNNAGGTAGTIYGGATLLPLAGGSGGGHGGGATAGVGGGGGGSVQLVANGTLTIGDSTGARGGVNAGGCGGGASANDFGGGGGGSGGSILVEAPNIRLTLLGGLAANGGGGSGGDNGTAGTAGLLDTVRGNGGSGGAAGGRGGASKSLAGETGTCDNRGGAGGGGATGRIRLNSLAGATVFDSGSLLSPATGDLNSLGAPLATEGTIDVH